MQSTLTGHQTNAVLNGIPYTVHTTEGIRGVNVPCLVWYDGKAWHVSVQGRELEVSRAICSLQNITG